MNILYHASVVRAKPGPWQLLNVPTLLVLCVLYNGNAVGKETRRPDVGAALYLIAYYYQPLLAASAPKHQTALVRLFGAIDTAHHGRNYEAISEFDKIAKGSSFSPRNQVLAFIVKARLEADRGLRLDGRRSWDSLSDDSSFDDARRQTISSNAHAAFRAANNSRNAFTSNEIDTIVAFDEVLERCLLRNPGELRGKTRSALIRHLEDGADLPNQGHMLEAEAAPLISMCLSDFDRMTSSVVPESMLAISIRAALRLEIIAGQVLAATFHGRLDLSQDILMGLVTVFEETVQPIQAARDSCAESWLWLRFATLEMRPSGSITTLGLDLEFEELTYPWLLKRINGGENAGYFTFTAPPNIEAHAEPLIRAFGYLEVDKIRRILNTSADKAKSCSNHRALDLAVSWTRALLELPWTGSDYDLAAKPKLRLERAANGFRTLAESARDAGNRRLERLTRQVSDALSGTTSEFSARLAGALLDGDIGLAVTLADTTAALATRRLVFLGDYASAVRALEQLQWSLYKEGLLLHSAATSKRLMTIYGLYPQRIARAGAATDYVHSLGKYIECNPDVRLQVEYGCNLPGYNHALRIEWGSAALMRLGFMAQLAMEWSSNSWMSKVHADRAALSPGLIPTDFTRSVDYVLIGIGQYIETITKIQRQISCSRRLELTNRLASEFRGADTWTTSGRNAAEHPLDPRGDISSFIAANRARFIHCDPAAERKLLESLESFDPAAVLAVVKNPAHDKQEIESAINSVTEKFDMAILAGFSDLASQWFRRLKQQGLLENKALAARFFALQMAVVRSGEEVEAAMNEFLPLASTIWGSRKPDPEQFHDVREAAIQLMAQSGLVEKALHWLEGATAAKSYNYRVALDVEPRAERAFERASLERRLIFDGVLPEADWSRLHELRLARDVPNGSRVERLPLDAIQKLSDRLPPGTAVVRFHFFKMSAVAFVLESNRPVRMVELSRDLNPLMMRLETFVMSLAWGVDASEDAKWAYDTFIKPLNFASDLNRLIIVPGDFLSSVPFEILPEASGRRLGEGVEVAYTNRLWRSSSAPMPHIRPSSRTVLVGIDGAGLAYAEAEVGDIAQLFETPVVVDSSEASQDMIQQHMNGADVLHFATHGHISSIDPFSSSLELAKGQSAPFWWLAKQHISLKLLVLSACQTAESGPIYSRWVTPGYFLMDDSLASIAEFVDTPYVVATLWPVLDDTSKALMVRFYRGLFGDANGDPIAAMHMAKTASPATGSAVSMQASTEASFRVFVPSVEDVLR